MSSKKYFKNFTWGNEVYELNKAIEHLGNWKKMKGAEITENEIELINKIYSNEL
jgi:ribosome biogenesis protein Tsr3